MRFICWEWIIFVPLLFLPSQHFLCPRLNNRGLCLWSILSSLKDESKSLYINILQALCVSLCVFQLRSLSLFSRITVWILRHWRPSELRMLNLPWILTKTWWMREIATWNAEISFICFVVLKDYMIMNLTKMSVYVIFYIV